MGVLIAKSPLWPTYRGWKKNRAGHLQPHLFPRPGKAEAVSPLHPQRATGPPAQLHPKCVLWETQASQDTTRAPPFCPSALGLNFHICKMGQRSLLRCTVLKELDYPTSVLSQCCPALSPDSSSTLNSTGL